MYVVWDPCSAQGLVQEPPSNSVIGPPGWKDACLPVCVCRGCSLVFVQMELNVLSHFAEGKALTSV